MEVISLVFIVEYRIENLLESFQLSPRQEILPNIVIAL